MKSKIKLPYSWRTITENFDENCLDFSVNINPLGIPGTVKQQLSNLADITGVYPDPYCKYLSSCLAEKYNVNADTILCGNGADDLLYRLVFALKPKHAVIIESAFEEYNRALELVGCEVKHYMTKRKIILYWTKEYYPSFNRTAIYCFYATPIIRQDSLLNHSF